MYRQRSDSRFLFSTPPTSYRAVEVRPCWETLYGGGRRARYEGAHKRAVRYGICVSASRHRGRVIPVTCHSGRAARGCCRLAAQRLVLQGIVPSLARCRQSVPGTFGRPLPPRRRRLLDRDAAGFDLDVAAGRQIAEYAVDHLARCAHAVRHILLRELLRVSPCARPARPPDRAACARPGRRRRASRGSSRSRSTRARAVSDS